MFSPEQNRTFIDAFTDQLGEAQKLRAGVIAMLQEIDAVIARTNRMLDALEQNACTHDDAECTDHDYETKYTSWHCKECAHTWSEGRA